MNGTNSLIMNKNASVDKVNTVTIDQYVNENKIKNIHFIKSDTEGHDFSVIQGAKESFNKEIIDYWQFEYNHRWIGERHYLKDVFMFLEASNYVIGKIFHGEIEVFKEWNIELEKYFEANFVIINKKFLSKLIINKVKFNQKNVIENE